MGTVITVLALIVVVVGVIYHRQSALHDKGVNPAEKFLPIDKKLIELARQGETLLDDELFYVGLILQQDNPEEAWKYIELAATHGHPYAQMEMGRYCVETSNNQFDEKAYKWMRLAAIQGNSQAIFNMGISAHRGDGGVIDYAEAYKCFLKAAELGHGESCFRVAMCYHLGEGIEQNEIIARYWAFRAQQLGYPNPLLGQLLEQSTDLNPEDIVRNPKGEIVRFSGESIISKASNEGCLDASYNIALWYRDGNGVEKDMQKAVDTILYCAIHGLAKAQSEAADIAMCNKDYENARKFAADATNSGIAHAYCILGNIYYNGYGVEKNVEKAIEYFIKAVNLGDDVAREFLALYFAPELLSSQLIAPSLSEYDRDTTTDYDTLTLNQIHAKYMLKLARANNSMLFRKY